MVDNIPEQIDDPNEVDEASCVRAGALAAYGFGDQAIADTLVLTVDQVTWAKQTKFFKQALAEKAKERADTQIDLSDGWDAVEKNSVAKVLSALNYIEDPKFALLAARTANMAKRGTGNQTARTIDPSRAGTVVHLTLNAQFVNRSQANNNQIEGAISQSNSPSDGHKQSASQRLPLKRVDMPTPKQVTDLLAPARPLLEKMREHNIEDQMTEMNFGDLQVDRNK